MITYTGLNTQRPFWLDNSYPSDFLAYGPFIVEDDRNKYLGMFWRAYDKNEELYFSWTSGDRDRVYKVEKITVNTPHQIQFYSEGSKFNLRSLGDSDYELVGARAGDNVREKALLLFNYALGMEQ